MTPAELVIAEFGGIRALARELHIAPSSVWEWKQPKQTGRGRNGLIPSAFHALILRLAQAKHKRITATDLILGRN